VDLPERGVAVLDRIGEDAHADEVEDVGEFLAAQHHLLVDRVVVLRPAGDLGADLQGLELGIDLVDHLGQVLLALRLALGGHAHDLFVALGVQRGEGQVLQFPLDLVHAQPVGQRRVDLQRLARLALLLLAWQVADVAHVVEPVGQLDQQHADVAGHGDDHLADGLGLGRLAGLEADPVQLGEPVGDLAHLWPELRLDLGHGHRGVLDHVVEQRRDDRGRVQPEVGHDHRHAQRMGDVGQAGLAGLAGVLLAGDLVGAADQHQVGARVAVLHPAEQQLDVWLGWWLRVVWAEQAYRKPVGGVLGSAVLAGGWLSGAGLARNRQPVGDRRPMLLRHRPTTHSPQTPHRSARGKPTMRRPSYPTSCRERCKTAPGRPEIGCTQ
jgi:hypothetical protein